MSLTITTDTHLGDFLCSLIERKGNDYIEGSKHKD